ncbi:hypothetical protein NDU88_003897 [Pleurodeles waltl]|uniref:Uncharacterized protein n=1 Tax=Pleurodeles waltl TaxID=8319 RepID=A0AAV7SH99_PLEWA|nr:hypothetical protein NDU88_003897 [Pleurodeles waltl]
MRCAVGPATKFEDWVHDMKSCEERLELCVETLPLTACPRDVCFENQENDTDELSLEYYLEHSKSSKTCSRGFDENTRSDFEKRAQRKATHARADARVSDEGTRARVGITKTGFVPPAAPLIDNKNKAAHVKAIKRSVSDGRSRHFYGRSLYF